MPKLIVKLKDPTKSDDLNWSNLDELFEKSQTHEVFMEDPQTGELVGVRELERDDI